MRRIREFDLDHRHDDREFEIGKRTLPGRGRPREHTPGRTTLVEAEGWPARELHVASTPGSSVAAAGSRASDPRAAGRSELDAQRSAVLAAVRTLGGGTRLTPELQRDHGARLGVDLGAVRLHTDSPAPRSLGALAFTHGTHVAVAPGVDLQSPAGEHVLTHELVHVAQNLVAGGPAMQLAALLEVGASDSPVEREAEAGAVALRAGQAFRVASHRALPGISLYEGPSPSPSPSPARSRSPSPSPSPSPGPSPSPSPSPSPGPSPSPAPEAMGTLVRRELEKRADPARKVAYNNACAQIDILRIQALQYTFQPSGITDMLLSSVWPWQSLTDHFREISSTNPYPDNSLQAWIQGVRGVVRILSDLAGWVGTMADIIAVISGGLGLLTSETIVGGLTFGGIAAISAEVGTIAGMIQILLNWIDLVLSVVEILSLILAIRQSKDPAERAKLAALLGGECQGLASTATTLVVQVGTMVVTAGIAGGVGAALSKSVKAAKAAWRDPFSGEFNFVKSWTAIRGELEHARAPRTIETTNPRSISDDAFAARAVVAKRTSILKTRRRSKFSRAQRKRMNSNALSRAQLAKKEPWIEVVTHRSQKRILRREELPAPKHDPKDKRTRHEVVYVVDSERLRRGTRAQQIRGIGEDAYGASTGQAGGLVQGLSGISTDPTSPPGGAVMPASPTLSHVEMWPSMLDKLRAVRAPLESTNAHLMRQYKRASDAAGTGQSAKVMLALGATRNTAGQLRFRAVQQQAEAADGAANSERGSATAQDGGTKYDHMRSAQGNLDGCFSRLGGQKVEKPQPRKGDLFDQAASWVADHTVGLLADATAKLQKWIATSVGHWAMAKAGLTKEELDMAGIDDSMRRDALKDHKSQADAKAAEADAAKVDPVVAQLMTDATKDEQLAIQAMVDAQQFMTSIDDAQASLGRAIAEGTAYVEQVGARIQAELEAKRAKRAVDVAHVTYGLSGAAAFRESVHGAEDVASAPANETKAALVAARAAWPELNISPGQEQVDAARSAFVQRHQHAVGRADAAAQQATAMLQGLIGTTNHAGVTAALTALDAAMATFDAEEEASAEICAEELDAILDAYLELIESAVQPQQIDVDADADLDPRRGN